MHHRDRMAHAELKANRDIRTTSLHDLYMQVAARKAAKERQARLATYLVPLVIVLVIQYTW